MMAALERNSTGSLAFAQESPRKASLKASRAPVEPSGLSWASEELKLQGWVNFHPPTLPDRNYKGQIREGLV